MYLDYKKNANKYWVVDTEADSLNPTRFWCAVAENLGTGEILEFDPEAMYDGRFKAFTQQRSSIFIGHNFISFDSFHLNRLLSTNIKIDSVIDTLVLSYLYHPHLPGGHSIEAYGERFGLKKLEHEDWSHFSPEMMERCRRDVKINVITYKGLCDRMNKIGFSEKSCEIEHRFRYVIDKQERRGFYFNKAGAADLCAKLDTELQELSKPIIDLFPPTLEPFKAYEYRLKKDGSPTHHFIRHQSEADAIQFSEGGSEYTTYYYKDFNIGSPNQRIEKLLSLGWQPTEFTDAGNPKVDEDALKEFADEINDDRIKLIADWMVRSSRKSTVEGWLKVVYPDSRIHGIVFSCGAGSRRCRHNKPNQANIPSNEAVYGEECRDLWTATPGNILLGGDAKAVQMRMFGHYLGDKEVAKLYIEGDPHQVNADATGVPRKKIKNVLYAMLFGAYDKKLGTTANPQWGAEEGKKIRDILYKTTPGLERAVKNAQDEWYSSGGLIQCIDKGFVRCPSAHAALNYQIQSAEAVLLKSVINKLDKVLDDFPLVNFVHDEIQVDCRNIEQANYIGEVFKRTMIEQGEELGFMVPMEGSIKIGSSWKFTH